MNGNGERTGSINNTIFVGRNVVDVNEVIRANVVAVWMHPIARWQFGAQNVGETHKINLIYVWLDCFGPLAHSGRFEMNTMVCRCHFNVCLLDSHMFVDESTTMVRVDASDVDECREQLFVSFQIRSESGASAATMCTTLTTRHSRRRAAVTIFFWCLFHPRKIALSSVCSRAQQQLKRN